jgi:HNH endonuclease
VAHLDQPLELFNYLFEPDFEKGILYRKVSTAPSVKPGDIAGGLSTKGYYIVSVQSKRMYIHRILYMMYHDVVLTVSEEIDHIDRNPLNNSIDNLRVATRQLNVRNRGKQSNTEKLCSSKYIGVHLEKWSGKWKASHRTMGKYTTIGRYLNEIDAAKAYNNFVKDLPCSVLNIF